MYFEILHIGQAVACVGVLVFALCQIWRVWKEMRNDVSGGSGFPLSRE